MLVNEMMVFYYVVQLKSFTQAGLKLKASKSYVSKCITQLEKDLKTRLLNRSTRQISLTEEGEVFYQHCRNIFEQVQMGYNELAILRGQAAGTLKISVPSAFALHCLGQPLAEFIKTNPAVQLNINVDSRIEDIIGQGYDLALRSAAALTDSNLIAQPVLTVKNILCASPGYLQQYGLPSQPEQLVNYKFAVYSSGKLLHELNFIKGKSQYSITIEPYIQSNNLDLILQLILSDCCMAILPDFMIKAALTEQRLVSCLPGYKVADSTLYAVYPDKKFVPLRVRTFIELLKTYSSSFGT